MTLEQLRIFIAVAERSHVGGGARALGVTQSAASAAVAALEARHGVLLFDRVGRGIVLSQTGRLFLVHAKDVVVRAEAAAEALGDLAGLRRGVVRIAASQTVANYWLPARLAAFASRHLGVELRLIAANTQQVAQATLEGACDVGFVEAEIVDARLSATPVGGDRLSLYAAPSHVVLNDGELAIDALRLAVWVMREPGSGTRSALEAALWKRGVDPGALNIALELPSNEAVLAAAVHGGLLAATSDLVALPYVRVGALARLAFDVADRRFDRLAHRERVPSRAAQAFIATL